MKTSVVLLALATAALAAPALHEETLEDVHIPAKFLDTFTRERKSTHDSSDLSSGSPVNQHSSQISEFGVSGRSFNLKKPIIIKKRVGSTYQVYRDSEEEKLDSPVPCRKQVRVSLCDENSLAKSADMMRSSTTEDLSVHDTKDDMKHSIKLAKEAVENLQKDLKNIEHNPAKSGSWKHGDSESDAELHQDIEVARQALEHIHKNFGIEAPTTHETTMKQAETAKDITVPLANTEEERLAQWKDAIENIQRNVELVRNIEESLKSTQDGFPHIENVPSTQDIHEHGLTAKEDMRVTETEAKEEEHKSSIEELKHSKLEKSSEHIEMKADVADKDMMESPSMVSFSKLQNLNHDEKARLTSESQLKNEHVAKVEAVLDEQHFTPQNIDTLALKVAEEAKERKTETEPFEKTEKIEKFTESEQSLHELSRDAAKELHDTKANLKLNHDKQDQTEIKMIKMKSAEHFTDKDSELINNEDKLHEGHLALAQLKQADGVTTEGTKLETQAVSDLKPHEKPVHESLVEEKAALNQNSIMPSMSSDSLAIDQHMPIKQTFQMKSAEDSKNIQHQLIDQSHMRWAQDKNFNTEMGLMKSAVETHQPMDHMKHIHSGHHHVHPHAHLDNHGHLRQHEHFMAHGKSADMDNAMNSNYYMNMRDSDNMGQDGHRFKWRPSHAHHHDSRTAYGAPAPISAPASGAVGLFPNANVGSCGIPLLLSCNPSVVSGSLAKAHPAPYSAPAYRTEDDFNFHAKRDVKKTENLVNKLNRTPTNTILKTSSI